VRFGSRGQGVLDARQPDRVLRQLVEMRVIRLQHARELLVAVHAFQAVRPAALEPRHEFLERRTADEDDPSLQLSFPSL
jgi:hypothetical protein